MDEPRRSERGPRTSGRTGGPALRLHVRELQPALEFQREVLGAEVVVADERAALVRLAGAQWTLVADAKSELPVMRELVGLVVRRGAGVELELEVPDPDGVEARARARGHGVLSAARTRPDGAREAHVVDRDGYVWVVRSGARG